MASPYLEFAKLTTLASNGGYSENPSLSQLSGVFLLSACVYLRSKWLWQNPIDPIDNATYQNILEMIEQAESELMTQYAVGSIIPSICTQTGSNLILLDGSSVLQADYPVLASCVPSSWLVGANINLPNMMDMGLFGTDDVNDLGDIIGENDHTLTTAEMPVHTHTQNPHSHSEIIPAVTPTGAGPIVAGASVVVPTPSTTGLATATNNNAGGDTPHNNIQQSMQVFYYIVAG